MARKHKKSAFEKWIGALVDDAAEWSRGRQWLPRLALLGYFAYALVRHLQDILWSDAFKPLNLCIHELGHYVFAPFGEFMHILGGSLFQCLVPLFAIPMFIKQRDYFGVAVSFGWLGTNLFDVGTYVSDARAQELPLVSPGATGSDELINDWTRMLSSLNLLNYDMAFARLFQFEGTICILICLALGLGLCWLMFKLKPQEKVVL